MAIIRFRNTLYEWLRNIENDKLLYVKKCMEKFLEFVNLKYNSSLTSSHHGHSATTSLRSLPSKELNNSVGF